MKISVIMLTYNREKLVAKAIESVLLQSFSDFEFIIVDNGSSDSSGAVADTYALKDARITVLHKEKGNIGSGRNAGLDRARGEYVTFIDDDDYCEPDYLQFLYDLAVENNAQIAICGATDKAFDEKRIMSAEEAVIELMWRKYYNVAFPTKLFHKNVLQDLRFPASGLYDDIALMYKAISLADTVAYHGLPMYTFYRHTSNNSSWTTNHASLSLETLDEYLHAYHEREKFLCKKFPNSCGIIKYFTWSFMISMYEKITRLNIEACYVRKKFLYTTLQNNKDAFLQSPHIQDFEIAWFKKYIG